MGEHAKKEFRGLLDLKTDLRQTAMAQMLRLNTKKMFKMGYDPSPPPSQPFRN